MTSETISLSTFGAILSAWRRKRRFSQLSFSNFAGISSRHLSFLETGRANPSRQMVIRLANYLEMPKPEVNRALGAAGFSPVYLARNENDPDLQPIHQAINSLLINHMPFPALVMDRLWNIVDANIATQKLLAAAGFTGGRNLVEILADQPREQSTIVNWRETVALLLERIQTELNAAGIDSELLKLQQKLSERYYSHYSSIKIDRAKAVIPTLFNINGRHISLFSTIAQFGSVQDMLLTDLRVELMFAMDEETRVYFENG